MWATWLDEAQVSQPGQRWALLLRIAALRCEFWMAFEMNLVGTCEGPGTDGTAITNMKR